MFGAALRFVGGSPLFSLDTMNKLEKAQTTFFVCGAFWFTLMSAVWIMWFFGLGPYTVAA